MMCSLACRHVTPEDSDCVTFTKARYKVIKRQQRLNEWMDEFNQGAEKQKREKHLGGPGEKRM